MRGWSNAAVAQPPPAVTSREGPWHPGQAAGGGGGRGEPAEAVHHCSVYWSDWLHSAVGSRGKEQPPAPAREPQGCQGEGAPRGVGGGMRHKWMSPAPLYPLQHPGSSLHWAGTPHPCSRILLTEDPTSRDPCHLPKWDVPFPRGHEPPLPSRLHPGGQPGWAPAPLTVTGPGQAARARGSTPARGQHVPTARVLLGRVGEAGGGSRAGGSALRSTAPCAGSRPRSGSAHSPGGGERGVRGCLCALAPPDPPDTPLGQCSPGTRS